MYRKKAKWLWVLRVSQISSIKRKKHIHTDRLITLALKTTPLLHSIVDCHPYLGFHWVLAYPSLLAFWVSFVIIRERERERESHWRRLKEQGRAYYKSFGGQQRSLSMIFIWVVMLVALWVTHLITVATWSTKTNTSASCSSSFLLFAAFGEFGSGWVVLPI